MSDEGKTSQIAREKASDVLAQASADLIKFAAAIARKYHIPDGINGLSRGEFLGRISFVVSMQRDLKRAGEDLIAQDVLRRQFGVKGAENDPDAQAEAERLIDSLDLSPEAPVIPGNAPVALTIDIGDLPGITVQTVKALKGAGLHQVSDIEKYTDEALLAINGIAGPTLAKVRAAVAQFRAGPTGAGDGR